MTFTAEWNGGIHQDDIKLTTPAHPDFDFASRTFRRVVPFPATCSPRPAGRWAMGPPNHVKDGIQPLAGLIETDWLPFPSR